MVSAQLLPPEILNVMDLLESMRGGRAAGPAGAGADLESAVLEGQARARRRPGAATGRPRV